MLHGEISNQQNFVIGIRCEDCLLKYKEGSVKDSLLNFILGKNNRAEVDESVLSLMTYIYRRTEYVVDLVVDEENYTPQLQELLDSYPFNRVVLVHRNISEITTRLNTGDLSYYIDNDIMRLETVNSKYAMTVEKFNTILHRKVR